MDGAAEAFAFFWYMTCSCNLFLDGWKSQWVEHPNVVSNEILCGMLHLHKILRRWNFTRRALHTRLPYLCNIQYSLPGVILKVHFQYCLHQQKEWRVVRRGCNYVSYNSLKAKQDYSHEEKLRTLLYFCWDNLTGCTGLPPYHAVCQGMSSFLFYPLWILHSVVKITAFKILSLWHAPTVLAHCGCVLYVVTIYMTSRNVLSCMHTHCCTNNQVDLPLHSWTLLQSAFYLYFWRQRTVGPIKWIAYYAPVTFLGIFEGEFL